MSAPIVIKDNNSGLEARVSKYGQLIVSALDYSAPVSKDLDVINTAFNFIEPKSGHGVVITDIIVFADRNVSNTTPADIEIYEADSIDDLTASPSILSPKLLRGGDFTGIGFNLLVPEGKFVNAKTDDATVSVTIMYYRVPAEDI